MEISGGKASLAVDLTPDLYGTLELHAYKILSSGSITRDTRLVVVDRAADLNVEITPGQETYRPGDTATLDIAGQRAGWRRRAQAALGLAIVDESVFALAEQDPGFAKLYFMLESEILTPRYDLHGFSVPDLVTGLPADSDPLLRGAVDNAARASLADAVSKLGCRLQPDRQLARGRAQARLRAAAQVLRLDDHRFYSPLPAPQRWAWPASVALPLWRAKVLGRSLLAALGVLSFLVVVFLLVPLGDRVTPGRPRPATA